MDYIYWSIISAVLIICIFSILFPYVSKIFSTHYVFLDAESINNIIFLHVSNVGPSELVITSVRVYNLKGRMLQCYIESVQGKYHADSVDTCRIVLGPGQHVTFILKCNSGKFAYVVVNSEDGTYKLTIQHLS